MEDFHKSPFGKMFMELLARHRGKTSKPSSKLSGKYAGGEIAFLDLRKTNQDGNDGPKQDLSWEIIPLSLGEDLTLNFGESPIDASESSLSLILEDNVPLKYYLSEKACRGILRRSEEKGTPLDPLLKQALWNTIVFSRLIIMHKISECDSAEMVLSKLSPEEWEQAAEMSR